MAKMNLWVDWDDEGESAGWQTSVTLPLELFQCDDKYAEFVSEYITRGLEYLAKEVELIGVKYGKHRELEDGCE